MSGTFEHLPLPLPADRKQNRRDVACPKPQSWWMARMQGLNPGHPDSRACVSSQHPCTALPCTCGLAGVHSVSRAQMWTGPNTHQLPNIEKCGSNWVYEEPHWVTLYKGVNFSFKSTANMNTAPVVSGKGGGKRFVCKTGLFQDMFILVALAMAWGVQWADLFVLA